MRQFTVLASFLLVLALLGQQVRRVAPVVAPVEPGHRTVQECRDCEIQGNDHRQPLCIEDSALEDRLAAEGERMIAAGETTDARVLIQQLERDSCELDLARREPATRDAVELFQAAKESVVVVAGIYKCRRCTHWHASPASGFVVSSSGAVVTNYHVVDAPNRKTIVVMTADQRVFPVTEVLAASRANDLAVLKVPASDLPALPVAGPSVIAPVGSAANVISHPDGRFYSFTTGVVSRYMKIQSAGRQIDALSITADYARGSSGAPVFDSKGHVIGIVMSTESVYYTEVGQQQRDLQMVFKTCIPSKSLHELTRSLNRIAGSNR